jgi:hypothetical protein
MTATTREELRERAVEKPGFYSPWLHLLTPSLVGAVVISLCGARLHDVTALQIVFAFGVFVLSNAVEWRAHKKLLHARWAPLGMLYDRHTPVHHKLYQRGSMAMKDPREFRVVLLPAFGILAILAITAPPAALLFLLGQSNLACLWLMVTTGYVVLYEWLHLSYHLPEPWLVGPLRLTKWLRLHHELHHDPELMTKWNFNVSLPIWDLVRRTYKR